MPLPTVLVIGASGHTGVALLRAAAEKAPTHAFLRTPSKLSAKDAGLCKSVQKGDALSTTDIENALDETNADMVFLSVGIANSASRSTLREDAGCALVRVLEKARFRHVRAVVIGAFGAGGTKLEYGLGVGTFANLILRHVLEDHDRQEKVLADLGHRCWIIRPVMLNDREGNKAVEFEDKAPSVWVGRRAVAEWVMNSILEGTGFDKPANVAAAI